VRRIPPGRGAEEVAARQDDAPRGRCWVEGDERKIHSVITNVLANAEKFTPDDARIDIRVQGPKEGKIRLTVTDNGVGLQQGQSDIQPFKTTNDLRYAGMGIGLTLARQILQAHQCDIALERGPKGRGAGPVRSAVLLLPRRPEVRRRSSP
jgi:signal transduction histidine kinase